jgi:hypothetical protein
MELTVGLPALEKVVTFKNKAKPDHVAVHPLTPEEEELVKRKGLTDAQIGWRRTTRAQLRGLSGQEFAEDAVSCFRASGECVFDLAAIERALDGCGEPLEMHDNHRLMVWFPAQAAKQYILGVDPAGGGTEGDYACAQVIDRRTGMQCAELHGHFPPRELAMRLIDLGKMYNQALIVVERNNHGHGVLAHLQSEGCLNVFREGEQEGWLTSAVSRPAMIENLAAVLVTEPKRNDGAGQLAFQVSVGIGQRAMFIRHILWAGCGGRMTAVADDGRKQVRQMSWQSSRSNTYGGCEEEHRRT